MRWRCRSWCWPSRCSTSTFRPERSPMTSSVLLETPLANLAHRGKVRDLYDLGDRLLIVATDRISAFDVVLPSGIPGKGAVLTQLSAHSFDPTPSLLPAPPLPPPGRRLGRSRAALRSARGARRAEHNRAQGGAAAGRVHRARVHGR